MRALPIAVAPLLALVLGAAPRTARACGACFTPPESESQVTDHQMVLAIGRDHTTLYDQLVYAGAPSSFAWVLPVTGDVDVDVAPNALFGALDQLSAPLVSPPPTNCQTACTRKVSFTPRGNAVGASVTVLGDEIVGPYEIVRLRSADGDALDAWLAARGFGIPNDAAPIVAAYAREGFDFVAAKLVPGANARATAPIAITMPGAVTTLPLRMIAAGAGARVGLTLYVLAEGRYEPRDAPTFEIGDDDLVWDWTTGRSNYADVRAARDDGRSWEIESSVEVSSGTMLAPALAGWAGIRLTRMRATLDRSALGRDLALVAAKDQRVASRVRVASIAVGQAPCPDSGGCPSGQAVATGCALEPASRERGARWACVALCVAALATAHRRRRRT